MSNLARRALRMPARRGEVRSYLQMQFDRWGRTQAQREPLRLFVLSGAAALVAVVVVLAVVALVLVPRVATIERRMDAAGVPSLPVAHVRRP